MEELVARFWIETKMTLCTGRKCIGPTSSWTIGIMGIPMTNEIQSYPSATKPAIFCAPHRIQLAERGGWVFSAWSGGM